MEKDRLLALSLRVALLGLFLWLVKGILVPVALGALFALVLTPVKGRLSRRLGRHAGYAPLLLTLVSVVLVVIPSVLMGMKAIASVNKFLDRDWAEAMQVVQGFVNTKLGPLQETFHVDATEIRD